MLREALAVGADSVLRLWDETHGATKPAVSSMLLAAALRTEGLPDLVFCGWRSLARGSGKMPALLGEYLNWPVVTDITALEIQAARVYFQRRLARGGRSEGEVTMPAVLAIAAENIRLRYASLPGLMQAKRASIPVRASSRPGPVAAGPELSRLDRPRRDAAAPAAADDFHPRRRDVGRTSASARSCRPE